MKILLILFFITFVSGQSNCPHHHFINKHVCNYCRSNNIIDVQQFAKQAEFYRISNKLQETILNSVFVGEISSYDLMPGDLCRFHTATEKHNCYFNNHTTLWDCQSVGSVRAHHNRNTGHYEYKKDI